MPSFACILSQTLARVKRSLLPVYVCSGCVLRGLRDVWERERLRR
jgi:hypothetical protein